MTENIVISVCGDIHDCVYYTMSCIKPLLVHSNKEVKVCVYVLWHAKHMH